MAGTGVLIAGIAGVADGTPLLVSGEAAAVPALNAVTAPAAKSVLIPRLMKETP